MTGTRTDTEMSKLNSKLFKDKMGKDRQPSIENQSSLEPTSSSGEKPLLPIDQMAAGEAGEEDVGERRNG